jgi:arylsulfatase A-like enzyme/uncharacterized membrane protein YbhN (UPF0104 family)
LNATSPKHSRNKKIVFIAVKVLFLAALIVFVFRPETFGFSPDLFQDITPGSLLEVLRELDVRAAVPWLIFALVMKLGGIFSGILRWRLLLQAQGLPIPSWYLTKCWFMGRAIGLFLPGTVGLDGYRLVESARYTGEVAKCTAVIVVEKVIGFVVLFSVVFMILPHGLTLFEFKPILLALTLAILGSFIALALLLLFRPRAAQVMVAVIPTPRFLRNKVNNFGASLRLFHGKPGTLALAILCGYGIHAGIWLMYYGAVMAVMPNTAGFLDILFAFALVTVGSIIGPTVSGAGVREAGFALVFGRRGAAAAGLVSGHLGLWIGEVIPFLLSLPLLLLTTRPSRETLMERIQALRAQGVEMDRELLHLSPNMVADYRRRLVDTVGSGLLAGLLAGALAGLGEALWLATRMTGSTELQALWWGPLVYGVLFACAGAAMAAVFCFLCLAADRFPRPLVTFALSMALLLGAGIWVLGRFRIRRDVLQDRALSFQHELGLLAIAAGVALGAVLFAMIAGPILKGRRGRGLMAAVGVFAAVVLGGGVLAKKMAAEAPGMEAPAPAVVAHGPNIVLIAADALRADYLALYESETGVVTPALDALAHDGVLYLNAFSQASWTKPSFGTIFTSHYPEAHGATGKMSPLRTDITTMAEALAGQGYYTKGLANNPNISSVFNFDQGFDDYTELKPSLYFGAESSSSKMVGYQVLRRVRQIAQERLLGGRLSIGDFYQPAEVVTDEAAEWLANSRNKERPFFLFLHYMDTHDPFMDHETGHAYARARNESPDPALAAPMAKAYRDEIAYMDAHIGRILTYLKEQGLYEDALIVFTADHGEEFYDHEGWWHGKTLYDEVIGVPLTVKYPGNAFTGTVQGGLVRHLDVAPTMAAAAGAPLPADWQGISLIAPDGTLRATTSDYAYSHNDFENNRLRAVRSLSCKRIEANEDNPRGVAPLEVYDLAADPLEQQNLVGQPSCGDALAPMLEATPEALDNHPPPSATPNVSEETQEQMESLGYL